MSPAATIYLGRVMHQRMHPVGYRFDYPVFSLLLDPARLSEMDAASRWFSIDRFNVLSFHRRDHGPRDGSDLFEWADNLLRERGVIIPQLQLRLLCFPRILGYGFTPLSIWYCLDGEGVPRAVICEVNNTFGEHHFYLLDSAGEPMSWPVRDQAAKVFHVSPLIDMDCQYRFRLARPGRNLSVVIRQYRQGRLMLVASQHGRALPFNAAGLRSAMMRTPLMTFKVMLAIHWQALRIWLRGVPFHHKPEPPEELVS